MPPCAIQFGSAARRLARARLRWRRAADEVLIGAIFDELRIVRRDGDCFGRVARQAALLPEMPPAAVSAPGREAGARQLSHPGY